MYKLYKLYKLSRLLPSHCRTDGSDCKSEGKERRKVVDPSRTRNHHLLTSKLSHSISLNITILHSYKIFPKKYIIVSRRVKKFIMPKCKSEGAEMSFRVVSGTWSPNWYSIRPTMVLKAFHKTGTYNLATLSLYEFHRINCINCTYFLECFSSSVVPIAQLVRA